jgi:beta-N-acetylhexosaminidase
MSDLALAAAKMFIVGFHGRSPTRELRDMLRRGVSGAILFGRNVDGMSAREVGELCAAIRGAADRTFLTCVDQEGGRVARLRGEGFTRVPSMREIGATGDESRAREIGATLARELRNVHIRLNFSPVLDVDTNPANPVIGERSFGADPMLVARLGCAMIEGMQSNGVAACGKHFPGHGDTSLDSHLELPALDHDMNRLRAVELPPFAAAVRAGVASVMTAHVLFRALDPDVPATMSRAVLHGILRTELGFGGVIISDDLEMKAIADHYGLEDAVVRGANAGVDVFLVCHDHAVQAQAIEVLVRAVERGQVARARLDEAARRIDSLTLSLEGRGKGEG